LPERALSASPAVDEATKNRGGDLELVGPHSNDIRFFNSVAIMRVGGEINQPLRTRLGFHVVQLADFRPVRQMSFEEVQSEAGLTIKNEKRRPLLQRLAADFLNRTESISKRF
jgi:PPIC-type PPIASE domain